MALLPGKMRMCNVGGTDMQANGGQSSSNNEHCAPQARTHHLRDLQRRMRSPNRKGARVCVIVGGAGGAPCAPTEGCEALGRVQHWHGLNLSDRRPRRLGGQFIVRPRGQIGEQLVANSQYTRPTSRWLWRRLTHITHDHRNETLYSHLPSPAQNGSICNRQMTAVGRR